MALCRYYLRGTMIIYLLFLLTISFPMVYGSDRIIPSLVNGCVNAVGGRLVFSSVDHVLPGADPLTLERQHLMCTLFHNDICGWCHNHESKLLTYPTYKNRTVVLYMDPDGSCLYFSEVKGHVGLNYMHEWNKYRLSNCGITAVSRNLKNTTLTKIGNRVVANDSSGAQRIYKYLKSGIHCIQTEIRPNGNRLEYSYNEHNQLVRVENKSADGSEVLSSLTFDIPSLDQCMSQPLITITGSDQRMVYYKLHYFPVSKQRKKIGDKDKIYLAEVIAPERPWEKFTYSKPINRDWEDYRISARIRPDNRFVQIEYYVPGHNDVGGESRYWPKLHGTPVKLLKEPAGSDATPIITYRFFYDIKVGDDGNLLEPGTTEVRDLYNHKTCYDYCAQERLTAIRRYEGTDPYTLQSVERFFWGPENTPEHTYLIGRSIETASGHVLRSVSFRYDPQGNVVAEEDQQRKIEYSYLPNTSWCLSKVTSDCAGKVTRESYVYDQNGVRIKTTVDDGTDTIISCVQPRVTAPIGLPEVVEERRLDRSGAEVLVHKIVNHHDLYGRLVQQDHYNASDIYEFSLFWEYDPQGNLIRETDKSGNVTVRRFDANKNCVYLQRSGKEYVSEFTYDYMNRRIRKDKVWRDGRIESQMSTSKK